MAEWFAPKRYGIGSGLPVSWQGWVVLIVFIGAIIATGLLLEGRPGLQAAIIFPLLALLFLITAKTTRGGWRWRWGGKE